MMCPYSGLTCMQLSTFCCWMAHFFMVYFKRIFLFFFFLIPNSILLLDMGHPMILSCVINFLIDFPFFFSYFIAYGGKRPTFVQSCTRCF